jgi:SAM-dependent methyltransferase
MSLAYKISGFNRRRKWNLFWQEIKPQPEEKILDIGFSEEEYSATDNFLEKNYPYLDQVTALGVDEAKNFKKSYPHVNTVIYDGKRFPFSDNTFDICWSNAVIEHVGDKERQVLFLKEIYRVGKKVFITTPNRFFPVEIHTRVPALHWFLPKKWFDTFLILIKKKWATGDYMNLLSLNELKCLLHEAGINNYKIVKNRLLFFTLDFVIIWEKD